ncbi:hypothetical protein Tco_0179268 [Tanacetum coccineum]
MCVCESYDFECTKLTSTPLQEFYFVLPRYGTNALSKFSTDTELVLLPLQDKLTLGDKSLDLSAFKLSYLFFSLLSSGSSSCWRSYGAQNQWAMKLAQQLMSTPIYFSAFVMNRLKLNKITRVDLVGPVFNLLKGTYKIYVELEYNMEECYRALTDQLDWTNPEGHKSPVDMSKPFPLQHKEVKISYDKDAALGISHWGLQRQQYYRAMINRKSKHEIFSTMRILSVVSVKIEKKSGYGYLEEIVVRRADQKLYKFKEEGDVIVDFVTALKMFTQRIIIQNRVEDVQLGVESYQRKLNLTKPQRTCPHISVKEPYTPNFDPLGVIYEDKRKKKR